MRAQVLTVAVLACLATACMAEGIDLGPAHEEVDAAQAARDRRACVDAMDELIEKGCPGGYAPRFQSGGEPVVATDVEEVGIPICGGVGRIVEAEAIADPEWVGVEIFQRRSCIVGCFAPPCGEGLDLCIAGWPSGELCNARCSDDIDEASCRSAVLVCNDLEPDEVDPADEACGLEAER